MSVDDVSGAIFFGIIVFGASVFTKACLGAYLFWWRHLVIFLQMKIATLSLAWLLIGLYSQSVQDDTYQTTPYDCLFSEYRQVIDLSITFILLKASLHLFITSSLSKAFILNIQLV